MKKQKELTENSFDLHMKNMKWREIKTNKVRTYQLEDEPEVIYVIKIRDNEYLVVMEDAFNLNTGNVEFHNERTLKAKFGINIKT
ncbi:MAG: hypothetical protein ACOCVF_00780 [bacterium]